MQLAGASCELTTDDLTKFMTSSPHSSPPSPDNHDKFTDLKWISQVIQMILNNPDDDIGNIIDSLLLSSANSFKALVAHWQEMNL